MSALTTGRRLALGAATVAATTLAVGFGGAAAAQASTTFYPPSSVANNVKIYLSRACHDRGTGSCQPNYGCNGYNENTGSARISNAALNGGNSSGSGLLDRGYIVRIGDQLTSQNINDSNNFRPKIHIPIHSNASGSCPNSAAGTWGLYRSTNGKAVGQAFLDTVGASSPGTNDILSYRTDLGEINNVTAVTGYLEAGFHTNPTETNWLNAYADWGWRIGWAVDRCLGYPDKNGPTLSKTCPF